MDLAYDPLFTLTYRVGGVVLKKEILMVHNEAQLMVRYTLEDAHSGDFLAVEAVFGLPECSRFKQGEHDGKHEV